jgi:serine protease Do
MINRRKFLALAGSGLASTVAGCPGSSSEQETSPGQSDAGGQTPTESPTATSPATDQGATSEAYRDAYRRVYRETVDSVVLIQNPNGSQGTGFVFGDGTIVTNAHVVGTADRVNVVYTEDESRINDVSGTDSFSDLAAIDAADAPTSATPLSLAKSEPAIGTRVAVIGGPFGLRGSLSSGVVSGVNRLIPNPRANFLLPNALQTDAPVNPGNSGGPLVTLDGTVLGVVNSGRGDNIAFAISAATVQRVVPSLVADGEYNHPFLGARVTDVTTLVARVKDLDRERGLLVTNVRRGSPAAGQLREPESYTVVNGFRVPVGGDIILTIDGKRVSTRQDYLSHLLLQTSPGQTIELTILRGGEEQTVSVALGTFGGG